MHVNKEDLQKNMTATIRSLILIIFLFIFKALVPKIPGTQEMLWGMTFSAWIYAVTAFILLAVVLTALGPFKNVSGYYASAYIMSNIKEDRQKYEGSINGIVGKLITFIIVIITYNFFMPVILTLNFNFLHFESLDLIVNIIVIIICLGTLIAIWKDIQPLIHIWTDKAQKVLTDKMDDVITFECPSCKIRNNKGVKFCKNCGASLSDVTTMPVKIRCACGAELASDATFCTECGKKVEEAS